MYCLNRNNNFNRDNLNILVNANNNNNNIVVYIIIVVCVWINDVLYPAIIFFANIMRSNIYRGRTVFGILDTIPSARKPTRDNGIRGARGLRRTASGGRLKTVYRSI